MNIKKVNYLIIGLFLLLTGCVSVGRQSGTCYYFDANDGHDQNDGKTPQTAWKSVERVKDLLLMPGDSVLFKRGSVFHGIIEVSGKGTPQQRIIIDAYGQGSKPCIIAPDSCLYTVLVKNSDYLTLQNLEIVNKGSNRLAGRTGVKVLCEDFGVSRNLILNALYIHDVNGTLAKHSGEGSGILIANSWKEHISYYDSLLIENCVIRRCERNAINWHSNWDRQNWHPNLHTVVRHNLIEEVPGDGIVPIGCDSTLIEYNLMRKCTGILPPGDAAAGIWPWSSDNTIIQFNEVSDHKAPWDGQGFDSDFNCSNTVIQYNYSHDNEGGFLLICCPGPNERDTTKMIGNIGTRVLYNVSYNDAVRTHKTRVGYFSPTIHMGGVSTNTLIYRNILHAGIKPTENIDRSFFTSDSWGGYADSTTVRENVFYTPEMSAIRLNKSTRNLFEGNYYLGNITSIPADASAHKESTYYSQEMVNSVVGFQSLFDNVMVGDGEAVMSVVNKERVQAFFDHMK